LIRDIRFVQAAAAAAAAQIKLIFYTILYISYYIYII